MAGLDSRKDYFSIVINIYTKTIFLKYRKIPQT